ncbi:hypothetical protein [Streptomyces bobili]
MATRAGPVTGFGTPTAGVAAPRQWTRTGFGATCIQRAKSGHPPV